MIEPIYTPTSPPEVPEAQRVAQDLLAGLDPERARLIEHHAREFAKVWKNPRVTPDEILAAMGTNAILLLQGAQCSVANLAAIAAIQGKAITDIIPLADFYPPREFIPLPDGTVTLAPPADGFDAWGNPLPVETPAEESDLSDSSDASDATPTPSPLSTP
jgi:hypothetical protein